jgi:hypothetical protein
MKDGVGVGVVVTGGGSGIGAALARQGWPCPVMRRASPE